VGEGLVPRAWVKESGSNAVRNHILRDRVWPLGCGHFLPCETGLGCETVGESYKGLAPATRYLYIGNNVRLSLSLLLLDKEGWQQGANQSYLVSHGFTQIVVV
jgi:hypothetical protein